MWGLGLLVSSLETTKNVMADVTGPVLGRSGSEGRLVAALLADQLSTKPGEEQQWTKDLLSWSTCLREAGKGALLIR